jgi:sec-independent protein translocase protein TatA
MNPVFAFGLGAQEMIIILIIGVLLFGRRLPEVGRYLGKGIVEFKKGLKGIEDEVETASAAPDHTAARGQIAQQPGAPHKFDPYTGKPLDSSSATPTSTPPAGS